LRHDLGAEQIYVRVDLADQQGIRDAFDESVSAVGCIDALVNNAGMAGPNETLWKYPMNDWRTIFAVNVDAVFLASKLTNDAHAWNMHDRDE